MISRVPKHFAAKGKITLARYIKDHSDMVDNQLKMYNNALFVACAGVGYMFHLEKENNNRRFDKLEADVKEIKALVVQAIQQK